MRANELRNFLHFHNLKLQFFQYFVGTSETLSVQMLVGLHVPTKLRVSIMGEIPNCPSTLATLVHLCTSERSERVRFFCTFCHFFQYFVGTLDTLSVKMTCKWHFVGADSRHIPYASLSRIKKDDVQTTLQNGAVPICPPPYPCYASAPMCERAERARHWA